MHTQHTAALATKQPLLNTSLLYQDTGNSFIGIGTATPAYHLHIKDSGDPSVKIERASNNFLMLNETHMMIVKPVGAQFDINLQGYSNDLVFKTNNLERLRMKAGGNIGIGTNAPAYALDVAGDLNLTGSLRVNGTAQQFGPTQEFHLMEDDAANDSEGAAIQLGNVNEIYISTAYQDDTWYFLVPLDPPDNCKITIAVNKNSNSCEVKLKFNVKFYPDGPEDSWQGFHGNAGRVHIFIWDAADGYWLGY